MLAAMTHPSRVLNLDMKAKALYAKELYLYIYIYIYCVKGTVSSVGRALHQYRRAHGFKSLKSLNFPRLYFHYC